MSEQIITKTCPKCKQVKPLSEFHKSKNRKDGHCVYCNACRAESQRQYRKTGKGKAVSRKGALQYSQSEKGKAKRKQYRQSERGKAAEARYRKTEKSIKAERNYGNQYPDIIKARSAVHIAVRTGKLPRPNTLRCSCDKPAQEYHHPSYTPKHWLDVIPVCKKCHNTIYK